MGVRPYEVGRHAAAKQLDTMFRSIIAPWASGITRMPAHTQLGRHSRTTNKPAVPRIAGHVGRSRPASTGNQMPRAL